MVRKILPADVFQASGALYDLSWYLEWPSAVNDTKTAILDGPFGADELEAIAWWMRNKTPTRKTP